MFKRFWKFLNTPIFGKKETVSFQGHEVHTSPKNERNQKRLERLRLALETLPPDKRPLIEREIRRREILAQMEA